MRTCPERQQPAAANGRTEPIRFCEMFCALASFSRVIHGAPRQYIIGLSKLSFETQREGQTRWTQKSISRLITQSERTCCRSENWQGVGARQYLSICLWCPPKTIVSDTTYTRRAQIRLFSPDRAWRMPYMNCLTEIEKKKKNKRQSMWTFEREYVTLGNHQSK